MIGNILTNFLVGAFVIGLIALPGYLGSLIFGKPGWVCVLVIPVLGLCVALGCIIRET